MNLLELDIFKPRKIKDKCEELLFYEFKTGFCKLLFRLKGFRIFQDSRFNLFKRGYQV